MIGMAKRRSGAIRDLSGPRSRAIGLRIGMAAAAVLLVLSLPGCGASRSSALVSPGKYERYPCPNIMLQIKTRQTRQAELEQLMARASEGVGGGVVNVLAYRGEHRENGDELDELTRTADAKQCSTQSPLSSDRAVF